MQLTQKSAIAAGHVSRKVAEFFLRVVVPEDEAVLAEFLLGLSVDAGVVEIALFGIGEEALVLGAPELRPRHGHAQCEKNDQRNFASRHCNR